MTIEYVRNKGGNVWVEVGERNEEEWDELLKTAGGCRGVTSVNYRASRKADQEADHQADSEDPKPQEQR